MRILVVEDEQRMAALLQEGLTEEGHQVYVARDGEEGLATAQSSDFDVLVLDVMLPRMDGLSMTRRLRERGNRTPVLMLTARDSVRDVVQGLDAGADDYLIKPFSFDVLLARLRAVSRRGPIPKAVCLEFADLCLDTATRRVTRHGQPVNLTPKEHSLLELLLRNAERAVSRDTILESVWGFGSDIEENTLEAFVRLLRNKIDAGFEPKLIHTVRGVGYC
ncbi:MAG: response regulator transcription factor, partial [Acidobacteriaceae bacterium]|nr:response regulator transcription factor [Acidobacteriaceae bacterium]